jgi:hypothetical protein
MQLIRHRINSLEELADVPSFYGIEFDVREGPIDVIVTHDPWTDGPLLWDFLTECRHAFYIVNIKCEGIEDRVLELLRTYRIENFFLLDCSFPSIVRLSRMRETRTAIRVSEYEGLDTAIAMAGKCEWIWVDVFSRVPVSAEQCRMLRGLGYKLCFVSPELQRQPEKIAEYSWVAEHMDAICTKVPNQWLRLSISDGQ